MSKHQITRNQPLALAAVLFGVLAVPVSAQNRPVPIAVPEKRFTIPPDVPTPVVVQTQPDAACELHPAGTNDPSQAMKLYGNMEGYVRFHFTPKQDSPDVRLQLDCTSTAVTVHPLYLHIADAPADGMPAPDSVVPAPKGSKVRPGLTDEAARQFSDDEILARGYPPRPDPSEAPADYAKWLANVAQPVTMLPAHSRNRADIHHSSGVQESIAGKTNSHWSGFVASGSTGTYKSVVGEWRVPPAIGEVSTSTYSSVWVGLDGYTTTDLVQAGTEQDVVDTPIGLLANYFVWTEVLPNQPTEQEQFSVSSGDLVSANVYVGDSTGRINPNGGYAWLAVTDHTTGQAVYNVSVKMAATFLANSAEWIVERPLLSSGFPELSNYGSFGMVGADVLTSSGSAMVPYTKVVNNQITMRESNTPQPDNNVLSTVSLVSGQADWMNFFWKNYH
jgi:hypothetical protein